MRSYCVYNEYIVTKYSLFNLPPTMANFFAEVLQQLIASDDTLPVIIWMKQHLLLHSSMQCPSCNNNCSWTKKSSTRDKYVWRCMTKECRAFKFDHSIRHGSFFAKSRISLQQWLNVIWLWSARTSQKQAVALSSVSSRTMVDVYNFFREVCGKWRELHPIQLGGNGVVVQIDESHFQAKAKHNIGRHLADKPVWVFGIVDTSHVPGIGYMEIVEHRDKQTLHPIIQRVCRPGTVVYSDGWAAYNDIQQQLGFLHQVVNHQLHFVDPQSGVHTQAIESYWSKQKKPIKEMKGVQRAMLQSYLEEGMWRDRFGLTADDSFRNLVLHISQQFIV